jgi:hypothetical protein
LPDGFARRDRDVAGTFAALLPRARGRFFAEGTAFRLDAEDVFRADPSLLFPAPPFRCGMKAV